MKSFICEWLESFFESWLDYGDSAAILSPQGEVLDLRYETLADIGTLGFAASTVSTYFSLEEGDVVILNDPYAGGTVLSTMTMVVGLPGGFTWIFRSGFRPKIVVSQKLEEEGLRIPPTPLIQGGELNTAILEAICSHPQAPEGLKKRIEKISQHVQVKVKLFQETVKNRSEYLSTASLDFFLNRTEESFKEILSDLAQGECKVETKFETGENVKLKLSVSDSVLALDFSGTSPSTRVCLTDSSTLGACFGALKAFLRRDIPVNSRTLSLLEVASPLGSMLNAKYPSPTFRGMTEGTFVVANTVIQALSELSPQKACYLGDASPLLMSLEFSKTQQYFDSIPAGLSATANGDGADALSMWVKNKLQSSIERIENQFPLLFHSISFRSGSGGKGKHSGGNGLTKDIELLAPAEIFWIMPKVKHIGKAGVAGSSSEIRITKPGAEEEIFRSPEGRVKLPAGTRIQCFSAGGHGYN